MDLEKQGLHTGDPSNSYKFNLESLSHRLGLSRNGSQSRNEIRVSSQTSHLSGSIN